MIQIVLGAGYTTLNAPSASFLINNQLPLPQKTFTTDQFVLFCYVFRCVSVRDGRAERRTRMARNVAH